MVDVAEGHPVVDEEGRGGVADPVRAEVAERADSPALTQRVASPILLAAFQAEPCASTWYGFVVRLGLLVHAWEVHSLLGDRDQFPVVTALALADVRLARGVTAEQGAG